MKSLKFFFTCTFLLSALVLITDCNGNVEDGNSSTLPETKWTIETVSPIGTEGTYPSLAIDNNGNPHISYLDLNDGYLKYAYKNGTTWTIERIEYVADLIGTIGGDGLSSIALDASNNPHICYESSFGFDPVHLDDQHPGRSHFKYAKKIGSSWTIIIIPLPDDPRMSYSSPFSPCAECSIAVDKTTGTANISLQMSGGLSGSVLGYWKPGLVNAVIVDNLDGNSGYHNAIALDGNGFPNISYEARSAGNLKYAHWNGSAFNLETVAPMSNIYWEHHLTSLAFDKNNNPHIAFYGTNGYKYASKNGSSWTTNSTPFYSGYPSLSLCLDATGNPHLSIVGNSVKHASWNGSSWSSELIEDDVDHCAIAVNNSVKIHIVYSTDTGIIKYASK